MTPSTSNTALLFVTRRPAWESRVRLKQAMHTDIFTARSGLEQRSGRQSRGRWSLKYEATLARVAAEARRLRTQSEVQSPLIVPFWTERGSLASSIVADVFTMDRESDADWFAPGDYVFLSSDLGDQFRQILDSEGDTVTLVADVEGLAYEEGATIWPCRPCLRDAGSAIFKTAIEHSDTETLNFTTL